MTEPWLQPTCLKLGTWSGLSPSSALPLGTFEFVDKGLERRVRNAEQGESESEGNGDSVCGVLVLCGL